MRRNELPQLLPGLVAYCNFSGLHVCERVLLRQRMCHGNGQLAMGN